MKILKIHFMRGKKTNEIGMSREMNISNLFKNM